MPCSTNMGNERVVFDGVFSYQLLVSIKYFCLCAIGLNKSRDWVFSTKTLEYLSDIPQFSNRACCEKCLNDNKHNSLYLECIFGLAHYLFLKAHSFPLGKIFTPWNR